MSEISPEKKSSSGVNERRISSSGYRTKKLVLAAALAGAYAAATIALGTISYGVINLRLTNIIIGVVPILGFPAAAGLSLGVLIANVASPLGPIDLVSAAFAFVGLFALYLLRKKSVALGLAIHSLVIALWVTFELSYVLGIPYFPLFYFVLAGNAIVDTLAYFAYKAMLAAGLGRRFERLLMLSSD
jgi:hypothetical protein